MPKPIVAWATAPALVAALAGCPSLSALECKGDGCSDAAPGGDAGPGGLPITCGSSAGAPTCAAPQQECCVLVQGAPTCRAVYACTNGSDVFCDDPSQCAGGPCYLCNAGGFQGTSCNYQDDIVKAYHCTSARDVYQLCHSSSQCDAGTTCKPLPVIVPDGDGGGAAWFSACQP